MEKITKEEAIKEVERIMQEGKVPVADLSIFDTLSNVNITEKIENQMMYTLELCEEFSNELKRYDKDFEEKYLEALRKADIIDNQSIEKEDPLLMSLYCSMSSDFAIDELMKNIDKPLDKDSFITYHDLLIQGSSIQDKTGLRDDNLKFVGEYVINPETQEKERKINYFPIDYKNIDKAIDLFLDYYNKDNYDNHLDLIKPIIVHGLIAALQLFKDGNTRYGRLLQTVGLWDALNKELTTDYSLPFVYGARQYAYVRNDYRKLANNLACQKDVKAWEDWIIFNFKKIQDCIYYNQYNIQKLATLFNVEEKSEPRL